MSSRPLSTNSNGNSIYIKKDIVFDSGTTSENDFLAENAASFEGNDSLLPIGCSPRFSSATFDEVMISENTGIPLHSSWTFWFDKAFRGCSVEEYSANLKEVYTVSTIQGFWSVYNNIPCVDEISSKYSYHLMRGSRRPMWEDDANHRGGTWKFKVPKRDTVEVWRELLLAAIGEQFDGHLAPDDDICGMTVSVKERDDLVQIWNIDCSLIESASVIQKVHELLPNVKFHAEFYKPHQSHHAYGDKKSPPPFSKS